MKLLLLSALVSSLLLTPLQPFAHPSNERIATISSESGIEAKPETNATFSYQLDAGMSKFMVRTFSGGLLWFKGHDHLIAIRDFTGEARVTPGTITPASLQLRIRADSLVETRDVFTEQQKQIINKELREIVLETAKYPEITFQSGVVNGQMEGPVFKAHIGGDLTMHGVTRRLEIPADVTLVGNDLRARGEFSVKRSDFNINATSAAKGTVRVRDRLEFTFDIVGHRR